VSPGTKRVVALAIAVAHAVGDVAQFLPLSKHDTDSAAVVVAWKRRREPSKAPAGFVVHGWRRRKENSHSHSYSYSHSNPHRFPYGSGRRLPVSRTSDPLAEPRGACRGALLVRSFFV